MTATEVAAAGGGEKRTTGPRRLVEPAKRVFWQQESDVVGEKKCGLLCCVAKLKYRRKQKGGDRRLNGTAAAAGDYSQTRQRDSARAEVAARQCRSRPATRQKRPTWCLLRSLSHTAG